MLWIKDALLGLIAQYGVAALFGIITFETLGLPLPGESALITMAAAAGAGKVSIWHVVIAAWLGAVLGDNIGYLIGRRYGKIVILRHGTRVGITHEKYLRAEQITAKYGPFMVVGARFLPILRQINGLVAGSTGMHWISFFVANVIGAAFWVGFWAMVAYQFGHSVSVVPWIWHHLSLVAMIVIPAILIVIGLLYWRLRVKGKDITPM